MSDKTFSLEWIQNEINYYSEMCVSASYFDYLDVLKQLRTVTARIAELELLYQLAQGRIELGDKKIARLVEVGDKAINAVMDETGFATMCPICRFTDDDQEVMTHSPDCPVTLWNKEAHE